MVGRCRRTEVLTSFGDVIPQITLKWNHGVNNYLFYAMGDIPVGDYDPDGLANLGLGHGAIDWGEGYTYFNPQTGNEFSAVAGFTYNFKNTDTQYQNGVDFHVDWGVSHFFTKRFQLGLVGYYFQQITDDTGAGATLGGFRSSIADVGPQVGYLFPIGEMQGYVNLRIRLREPPRGLERMVDLRTFAKSTGVDLGKADHAKVMSGAATDSRLSV